MLPLYPPFQGVAGVAGANPSCLSGLLNTAVQMLKRHVLFTGAGGDKTELQGK